MKWVLPDKIETPHPTDHTILEFIRMWANLIMYSLEGFWEKDKKDLTGKK